MAAPADSDTKHRILDAAERLFHQRGFNGTSLRAVTTAAGVNVAAVHYHLGSKEALLSAVIERRAAPINAERIARLERLLARSQGPPAVQGIVEAFLGPTMDPSHAREVRDISTLIFRESSEFGVPLVVQVFAEVAQRFIDALERALPQLPADEVAERFHYLLGVMVQVVSGRVELAMQVLRPDSPTLPADALFASVVAFVSAGLHAPSSRARGAA